MRHADVAIHALAHRADHVRLLVPNLVEAQEVAIASHHLRHLAVGALVELAGVLVSGNRDARVVNHVHAQ